MASHNFIKGAVPFMVLVLGAPYIVQHFNSVRYKYRSSGMLSKEEQLKVNEAQEARKAGVALDKSAEAVLEKIRADNKKEWHNIRGPRPWEDSKQVQNQQHSIIKKNKDTDR